MIKIKNYIFQEKDIKQIYFDSGSNKLLITKYESRYDIVIGRVTFDDIEWNYGQDENNKLKENNKELVETNMELAVKNKELEEENEKLNQKLNELRSDYSIVVTENKKLKYRIDKINGGN